MRRRLFRKLLSRSLTRKCNFKCLLNNKPPYTRQRRLKLRHSLTVLLWPRNINIGKELHKLTRKPCPRNKKRRR
jgi:hypothetical protein